MGSIRAMTANAAMVDQARAAGILEVSTHGDQLVSATLRAVVDEPTAPDVLAAVLATAPALERLDIAMADTAIDAAPIVALLSERPRPGLRYLALREYGFDPAVDDADAHEVAVSAEAVARLAACLPELDELELVAPCFADGLVHPTLRSLILCGVALAPGWRGLDLPRLERLRWWLPGDAYGVAVDPGSFDVFWKADLFPRLTELDLLDADFDGDVFTPDMLASPLLRHLEVLRVPHIDATVPASQLAHLRRIDVRWEPDDGTIPALPMLRAVTDPPRAAQDDAATPPELYVTGEEAFVFAWQGFAARALIELPDTVSSVALYGVTWTPEQERAFGAAATRFREVRMPYGGRLAGDDLVIGLAAALPDSRWEILDLGRAWLTSAGVAAIGDALARTRTPLHTLTLRWDHGGDTEEATAGAVAALTAGVAATNLRSLTLKADFIRTVGEGRELGEALPASLSALSLRYPVQAGGYRGDPAALAAFLAAARQHAGIRRLDVLAHPAVPGLADLLPPLDALAWREASGAYANSAPPTFTGDRIAEVLRTQPTLRELDLTDTDLDPSDVTALAAAVAAHPALTCLRLSDPVMSVEAMRDLADAVRANSSLTSLTFAQHTRFHARHGRVEGVVNAPLIAAIMESGRTFDELRLGVRGQEQVALLDLLAEDRLRAVDLRPLSTANTTAAMAALTRASGLRRLSLNNLDFDRAGVNALCAVLQAVPVRELNLAGGSLWSQPAAVRNKFRKVLQGTGIEILGITDPFPEILQVAGTMPSLRRIDALDM